MAIENERRYWLKSFDISALEPGFRSIEQGYFVTPATHSARIRRTKREDGTIRAFFTVKKGFGESRNEIEVETVDLGLIGGMLVDVCPPRVIYKDRRRAGRWEVDLFRARFEGLVLAEFERRPETPKEEIVIPRWFGEYLDVTEQLNNHLLATMAAEIHDEQLYPYVARLLTTPTSRIVVTGGPGCGKTEILKLIGERYAQQVHTVPEVASIVILQVGARPPQDDPNAMRRYQAAIGAIQAQVEGVAEIQMVRDHKKVLVTDRGRLDIDAYMPKPKVDFERIFQTTVEHEYRRYEQVLCIKIPPREVYERIKANNPARSESYEQALAVQKRIIEAWEKHPGFTLYANDTNWESVRCTVMDNLRRSLGIAPHGSF